MNLPDNFIEMNDRRMALIDKKYNAGGLTPEEEAEFEKLQEIVGKIRDAMTPAFPPELQATLDRMKEPGVMDHLHSLPYKDVEEIPFIMSPGRYFHAMFYYPVPPSTDKLLGGNITGLVWRLEDEPESWRVVYRFRWYKSNKLDSHDSGDDFSWYTMHTPGAKPEEIVQIMRYTFERNREVIYEDMTPNEPDRWEVLKIEGDSAKFFEVAEKANLDWLHVKRSTPEELEKRTGRKAPTL